MKKILVTFIIPVFVVFGLFVLAFLLVESDRIQHYKQYLIPLEGRICTYPGSETVLPFYFLDEKELSELAQANNIQEAFLVKNDGTKLAAKDWNVTTNESLYAGSKYDAKQLTITIFPEETIDFCALLLKYSDKEELHDLGSLQVYVIPESPYEPYFQCWSTISGEGDKPLLTSDDNVLDFKAGLSYGVFTFSPARQTRILEIDLGIPDLAVDSESLKQIPTDFDFGISMIQDPAFNQYLQILEPKKIESERIHIDVHNSVTYLASLETTRNSLAGIGIFLISPTFRCLDLESGEAFSYANTNFVSVGIEILDDKLAGELLEKEGI
jgi:hypothetical protein